MEQAGKDFDKVCLNEAAKIIEARAKNKSVANVPATDLTDKNVTFMLLPTLENIFLTSYKIKYVFKK